MGYAIETIPGSYTAAASTGAQAYTAGTAQSFQIRALAANSQARIHALWTQSQDAGYTRIRSPRMHDDVVGMQSAHFVNNASPLLLDSIEQEVYSQDTLIVEDYFTAAPGTNVQQMAFQVYYDDVPGLAGNFWTWAQVSAAMQAAPVPNQYLGVYTLPVPAGTVGAWGTGVALNSSQDVFKANSWYALLGYTCPTRVTAWSILGTDLGNLYVGGPGSVDPIITRNWFKRMEEFTGRPSIPVINSQNKGATLVQVFDITTATAKPINLIFAYLGPTGA